MVGGCKTTDPFVVQPGDELTTLYPDTQDFALKAEEMVASLLDSSVLEKAANQPPVVGIAEIKKTVPEYFDTDLLTKKIRVALTRNNKARIDTTGGVLNPWDFTLSGKIHDTYAKVGKKSQHTYTFQLSLTDSRGLTAWEEEKAVIKRQKR